MSLSFWAYSPPARNSARQQADTCARGGSSSWVATLRLRMGLRIFDTGADGSSSLASRGGGFVAYQPIEGDHALNSLLDRRWRQIRTDAVARESARHLRNAIFLADVSAWRPVIADAALLQYFMVIESVARYVARQVRSGYRDRERQERENAATEGAERNAEALRRCSDWNACLRR